MKRYVVLAVNENPIYLYYLPLVCGAWRKFGWHPVIFFANTIDSSVIDEVLITLPDMDNIYPLELNGYRSETIAQISRLYAACVLPPDSYIMTSDADMLPLSDYWKYDPEMITVWGHDLTGYQHVPICYIGMKATRWVEVMGLISSDYNGLIKRDLDSMPNAKSEDSVKRWVVDQDLITERLAMVQFPRADVFRGTYPNGYAIGRVDRSAWTLQHATRIDAHLHHGIYQTDDNSRKKFADTMRLLEAVWPEENFDWFIDYTKEFKKLC